MIPEFRSFFVTVNSNRLQVLVDRLGRENIQCGWREGVKIEVFKLLCPLK